MGKGRRRGRVDACVLVQFLPEARTAVRMCRDEGVPLMFLTNSGGRLEGTLATWLSEHLGVEVAENEVCLSHTPMRELVPRHGKDKVLVIGEKDSLAVARSYGFQHAVDAPRVIRDWPDIYPLVPHDHEPCDLAHVPFGAVLCLHDSASWGPELQVCVDALRGGEPPGTGRDGQVIPLYLANSDLLFGGAHPAPRIAGGAFVCALEALFERITGHPLEVTRYGKPHAVTYRFAEERLRVLAGGDPARIVMVGDNPEVDIRGARQAGGVWRSALVRTGIFGSPGTRTEDAANDPVDPADEVHETVAHAVEHALSAWRRDPAPQP